MWGVCRVSVASCWVWYFDSVVWGDPSGLRTQEGFKEDFEDFTWTVAGTKQGTIVVF